MQPKYLFVTGGVVSSLGKGLSCAALGTLLENRGLKIFLVKLDPYLNVDPGTMNPFQHGEVYVTDDGAETDLDLGHYFRFTNSAISQDSNLTSGRVYEEVIKKERRGDYLGATVQVIPHITDQIKLHIDRIVKKHSPDILLIEVGGTVGDIESLPFLEAIRQLRLENQGHCLNIHLTYVPYLKAAGELKTKPSQHSVQSLREIGIIPDIILCRSENPLPQDIKSKIALFCSVAENAVVDEPDVKHSIYEVPLELRKRGFDELICQKLSLKTKPSPLIQWQRILNVIENPQGTIKVGIVGKYLQHQDAYKSVFEALHHGAIAHGFSIEIEKIEADNLTEDNYQELLNHCDGFLVPGGFGERGWMGKLMCAKYCRETKTPFFGICLGMQIMAVEFARNVLNLEDAISTEVKKHPKNPIISLLSEQRAKENLGGTMRLGSFPCSLQRETKAHRAYNADLIEERHRHRYEFNNDYKKAFETHGMIFSGVYENHNLIEIAELKDHLWMVGVQFHPEFKSKPTKAHPLFSDFIKAMIEAKTTSKAHS